MVSRPQGSHYPSEQPAYMLNRRSGYPGGNMRPPGAFSRRKLTLYGHLLALKRECLLFFSSITRLGSEEKPLPHREPEPLVGLSSEAGHLLWDDDLDGFSCRVSSVELAEEADSVYSIPTPVSSDLFLEC